MKHISKKVVMLRVLASTVDNEPEDVQPSYCMAYTWLNQQFGCDPISCRGHHSKELKKAEHLKSIFKTILAISIETEQAGALNSIPLQFKDETERVNLKIPILFIIGDILQYTTF
jgi:hypothetical protein